ncbi:SusC/RagA family TonB-linked outer membrane protein [Labilibaculum euxinus]|uniref:SusC/RagA family TonB-linked outer membrane protein n=1 Tax=Labilibaculum euxinus TaxID=2686357 RepID=A0A7M4D203_9BACT|nr:TonB-dependent receptor [Labilibaculum euxinus]MUP36682.1 SusC/RagA family TonB-linked outer membrane protein [Labilibaculum euxinus]MVB05887.1 SusC/RagA family TonB-linked outer membrane protein [Labilibaculum euxinus]
MKKCYQKRRVIAIMLFLFLTVHFGAIAQSFSLQGTVTDVKGIPLPGVSISIVGTTQGTITDIDGKYSLEAPGDSQLKFQFIGFLAEIVSINNQTTIDVTLKEDVVGLSEVVVVGYGTQRKEAVTGSVANIKGEVMREVPSANISQALQGRIAGVNMQQTSSKPGALMQIRIRGSRSLSANNDPLVVLDGMPFSGSISDINPTDIKTIDILKDASATAIYGSRGANGVIMVTTKTGKKGKSALVTYNGYQGINTVFSDYPMMEGSKFVELRKLANKYTNGVDEADDVNTNWQDLWYRTANVTNHNIAVTGGTEKGSYSFSTGFYKEEAVTPGTDFSRLTLHGSIDQEIGNYFRIGFSTNNNYTNSNNGMGMYGVLSMSPIADPYDADGNWKRTIKMPLDENWNQTKDIVNALGDRYIDKKKAFASYNTLFGEVKIPGIEGLKYRISLAGNLRTTNDGNYTGEGVGSSNATTVSTAGISNSRNTNWVVQNLLTYDRRFGKHSINVVGLYSVEETLYNSSNVSAKDIPADAFQFYNLGRAAGEITVNPEYQNYEKSGLMSYMGRAMYAYDNRYMVSATIRSDASSRLAEGHKWHTYPALSVGWNIANESFMSDITAVNALKLRVGFGQTSNQSVKPYATLGVLKTRPYNYGTTYSTGTYVTELPNNDLGWEFSKTWNYGLDFALLNHRLTGAVEYYITKTEDVLLGVGLPPTSGVSSVTQNIGTTENKGLEFSLNGVILDDVNGWTWDVGVNFYSNKNKLTSLASGQTRDEGNWWFVGHPINVVYDYKRIGIWQEGDANLQDYEEGGNVGMIKVQYYGDYDENGIPTRKIGPEDLQVMDLEPDFQGGFNTRVAYKGFDFSLVGAFQHGGTLISTLYSSGGYLNMLTGRRGNVDVDYWTPDNTGAKYPLPGGSQSGDNPKYGSTLGYFDASYVKIRSLSLGYNFSQKIIEAAGFDKLRLYATVQNPFVLFSPYTRETGLDPETNSYGNENAAVAYSDNMKRILTQGYNTPSVRKYVIGIELTF